MKDKITEEVLKEYNKLDDVAFDKMAEKDKLDGFLIDLTIQKTAQEIFEEIEKGLLTKEQVNKTPYESQLFISFQFIKELKKKYVEGKWSK